VVRGFTVNLTICILCVVDTMTAKVLGLGCLMFYWSCVSLTRREIRGLRAVYLSYQTTA